MASQQKEVRSLKELYHQLHVDNGLHLSLENFVILNLAEVGFELPYQSSPFKPDYFSFLFVKDGKGAYTIDEKTFNVQPGSIYFTNPSNYRTFSWENIREVFLITFDEVFLKNYLKEDVFERFPFLLTETLSPQKATPAFFEKVEQIYLLIHREYNDGSPNKFRIIGNLLAVLLFYIKEYFWEDYQPIYEGSRQSQIVTSFKLALEAHYRDLDSGKAERLFHVQDYADLQGLNPAYLSTVIKAKTGRGIQAWIAEKTIALAKSLLQNTRIPIKEISYALGFNEVPHFSNYFKKNTNMSASQYRKIHNNT